MRTGYTTVDVTEMGVGAREIWRSVIEQSTPSNDGAVEIGSVLKVFDRSVYLEFDHQGLADRPVPPIVLLGTSGLRSGPLLTRVETGPGFSFDDLGISSDAACRLGRSTSPKQSERYTLAVDHVADVRIDAELLQPSGERIEQYHDVHSIGRRSDVWGRAQETLEWIVESDIEDGLDWFPLLAAAVAEGGSIPSTNGFGRLAASWGDSFETDGANSFDAGPWEDLIGRGPGATPSGDDVISGVLLTLNHVSGTELREDVRNAGMEIVARAVGSTPKVSASLMEQAALGRGTAVADRCLRRLLTPTRREDRRSAISELIEVGHTSGADMLFGMLLTILAIAPLIGTQR
jgi:hypothetical protein